jgi:TRAP-type C4-dicarboxylate transport system permease large subunit
LAIIHVWRWVLSRAALIPPSFLLIGYAFIAEVSAGSLFNAVIAPGLLLAVFYSIAILTVGKLRHE